MRLWMMCVKEMQISYCIKTATTIKVQNKYIKY